MTTLKARDLINRCPGLTYRKLDYWCRGGCFGPAHAEAPAGTRRRFTDSDLHVAQVINRVSLAFQTDRGGHADLVTVYAAISEAARHYTAPIRIVLGPGVELHVDAPELEQTA